MIYFDTSYLARLYVEDYGWEAVRSLAATDAVGCCLHGRAETVAALHRKLREGVWKPPEFRNVMEQFSEDCQAAAYRWLVLSSAVIERLTQIYTSLPATVSLRAADAMHLACAVENGLREIYSNDEKLLAAASHFGLKGRNIIVR